MPELPEVETMVRALRGQVRNRTIARSRLIHDDVVKNRSRSAFLRGLRRAEIRGVSRRAKNAVFDLRKYTLVVQPGMTGSFQVTDAAAPVALADYPVLTMTLDDGRRLTYRDVRRLGRIYLLRPSEWESFSARIGPEPLDAALTTEAFGAALERSRQAIKKVIMDQRRLAGVGNIYANEALFVSGIDPSRPANTLTASDHEQLLTAIRNILMTAVNAEGTTVRDYRTASGKPGGFQTRLLVYGREDQPCRNCGTPLVGTHTIDARSTVFCYHCQR
jgi:formamidopyrimidine-DNA glycosylase